MHRSGPLPLTFEGPEQGFGGKNCQNESQGKPCVGTRKVLYGVSTCRRVNLSASQTVGKKCRYEVGPAWGVELSACRPVGV